MLCIMERRFFDRCDSSRMTKLTCSSCRRRTATSALNAKLGTETLIMNVSRRRKDSLRLLRQTAPHSTSYPIPQSMREEVQWWLYHADSVAVQPTSGAILLKKPVNFGWDSAPAAG